MQLQRILTLRNSDEHGKCVVYVMSRDQRVRDNHALLAAQQEATQHTLPLVVLFNLLPKAGVRAREHFVFMMRGLEEVASDLAALNIPFIMRSGDATTNITEFCNEVGAGSVYFDFSPLKGPRAVAKAVATQHSGSVHVVDTHNIVPVWVTSQKQEFAAHTLRPKIHRLLESYLIEPDQLQPHPTTLGTKPESLSFDEAYAQIASLPACGITVDATPGAEAATKHLQTFIADSLETYATGRNDIANDMQSGLSPYLHFGHVSSLRVALEVLYATNERPLLFDQAKMAQAGEQPNKYDGMNALYEEMIVRKELSDNYCLYMPDYTSFAGAATWAQNTLNDHATDTREFTYSLQEWEQAKTHDPSWNAAQKQLTTTGKIHGYMRMYWAKKILEWSDTPEHALEYAIYLNDKYSIDGGDPNGYVGVLWSIVGVHDRPWTERPVFGKIRYMNAGGLKRKFDVEKYIATWTT